jgi:hypothetical protein
MKCSRCGRELQEGETMCLNCGEPTVTAAVPKLQERPSDIITCLIIGLFVIFGIPAVLFGGFLVAVGLGYFSSGSKRSGNDTIALVVAVIPLGVFIALLFLLVKVGMGRRGSGE